MKIFYVAFTAFLLLTFVECNRATKPVVLNDLPGTLTDQVVTAFNTGDAQKISGLCTDDAIVISCGWRMCGKDSIASGMRYLLAHSSELTLTTGYIKETDENVFINALMVFRWKNESYFATAKGLMNMVWKKMPDNSWKITFLQEDHGDIPEK